MLDKAILSHLRQNEPLKQKLTWYADILAIFNQSAPPDTDDSWTRGPQYPRIVFTLDTQDDAARAVGGKLLIDAQCQSGKDIPEDFEAIVREWVDGCFFSDGGNTMAAQWQESRYFTQATDSVCGVTLAFDLLAFPRLTVEDPDIIQRVNAWTAEAFPSLFVLGRSVLPDTWRPSQSQSAIYWRVSEVKPAGWIPDTHQTLWRTETLKGHVFAADISAATVLADEITHRLDSVRRLVRPGETQIMVNRANSVDAGADALHTGQITVEATFGRILPRPASEPLNNIHYT